MQTSTGKQARPSRAEKTLHLHIGFGRTGTSSLQSFFARNTNRLSELGIHYPIAGRNQLDAHHYLAAAARPDPVSGYETDIDCVDHVAGLREETGRSDLPNVLISSEVFSGPMIWRRIAGLKKMFAEIRVVVYLRRQDSLTASTYNQWVKGENLTKRIDEIQLLPFHFDVLMKMWDTFLGSHPGRIIVRSYEREQLLKNDVIDDFMCATFGIDVDDTFTRPDPSRANRGLAPDALEFKRIVNSLCPNEIASAFIGPLERYSACASSAEPGDEISILEPRQRREIMRHFEAGNADVARRYLDRPDGALFGTGPPDSETSWRPPSLSYSEALDIARFVLLRQAEEELGSRFRIVGRELVEIRFHDILRRACTAPAASPQTRIENLIRGVASALAGQFQEPSEVDVIGRRWGTES